MTPYACRAAMYRMCPPYNPFQKAAAVSAELSRARAQVSLVLWLHQMLCECHGRCRMHETISTTSFGEVNLNHHGVPFGSHSGSDSLDFSLTIASPGGLGAVITFNSLHLRLVLRASSIQVFDGASIFSPTLGTFSSDEDLNSNVEHRFRGTTVSGAAS
jgi:hypothetical protein